MTDSVQGLLYDAFLIKKGYIHNNIYNFFFFFFYRTESVFSKVYGSNSECNVLCLKVIHFFRNSHGTIEQLQPMTFLSLAHAHLFNTEAD